MDANDRKRSQNEIAQNLNKIFKDQTDLRIFVTQEQTISVGQGGRGSLPVQFVLQNLNFDKLKEKFRNSWMKLQRVQFSRGMM